MKLWKSGRVEVTARESRKDGAEGRGGGQKNGRRAGSKWKYDQLEKDRGNEDRGSENVGYNNGKTGTKMRI